MSTLLAALGAGCAAFALGCGSGTRTVSVASSPPSHPSSPSAHSSSTVTSATATSASHTSAHGQTSPGPAVATSTVTSTTRTAAGPAFAQGEAEEGGDIAGAEKVMKADGYTPVDSSDYHSNQTLRVLVGTHDPHQQRAFFFVGSKYIGTDTSEPSASVSVVRQSDTEVTLAYALYRPHDPPCCPSAGHAEVRFQLNDGKLVPLDSIPPTSSQSAPSRG